jgi:hypothetical protein
MTTFPLSTDMTDLTDMRINLPEVLAAVTAEFDRYEKALVTNDVDTLDDFFWHSEHALRYGVGENLYGFDAIAAFRAGRPANNLARERFNTVIVTFGENMAVANTEFRREGTTKTGRQSQTWCRFADGWHIVSAHVSLLSS